MRVVNTPMEMGNSLLSKKGRLADGETPSPDLVDRATPRAMQNSPLTRISRRVKKWDFHFMIMRLHLVSGITGMHDDFYAKKQFFRQSFTGKIPP